MYGILDLSKVILCRIHQHFKELLITVVLGHDCQHDVAAQGPVPISLKKKKTAGGTSSRRRLMDLSDIFYRDSTMG